MKVLFVCLGNICRSPAAEAVFNQKIKEKALEAVTCDSAGTINMHEGEKADARMRDHASRRDIAVTSISRPFIVDDFDTFDLIIGMDDQNIKDIKALARDEGDKAKVKLMMDYSSDRKGSPVPDPYWSGPEGFENVLNLLEDACDGLTAWIISLHR